MDVEAVLTRRNIACIDFDTQLLTRLGKRRHTTEVAPGAPLQLGLYTGRPWLIADAGCQ